MNDQEEITYVGEGLAANRNDDVEELANLIGEMAFECNLMGTIRVTRYDSIVCYLQGTVFNMELMQVYLDDKLMIFWDDYADDYGNISVFPVVDVIYSSGTPTVHYAYDF